VHRKFASFDNRYRVTQDVINIKNKSYSKIFSQHIPHSVIFLILTLNVLFILTPFSILAAIHVQGLKSRTRFYKIKISAHPNFIYVVIFFIDLDRSQIKSCNDFDHFTRNTIGRCRKTYINFSKPNSLGKIFY
jgi:hypothetical protein